MSVNAHIQQLKSKHQMLESEIADLTSGPSVSNLEILRLKREKLRLKDQISRLQSAS